MLESARTNLIQLKEMKNQVLVKHKHTEEQVLLWFIHSQVKMHGTVDIKVTEEIVLDMYQDYFHQDYEGEYAPYIGIKTDYSYGDLVKDRKYKDLCVIVKETQCYIDVWCFQDTNDKKKIRKRLKGIDNFYLLKRFKFF